MEPSLVILAAGMGSRYGGLKQMDSFGPNGESIIDYSLYDAIEAGFTKIVFIIRESFKADFEAAFSSKLAGKVKVEYVSQELTDIPDSITLNPDRQKPWGTAHAVLAARHVVQDPFAVINADDYYGAEAYQTLIDFFANKSKEDYAVVSYYLKNTLSTHGTVNRGICKKDNKGYLQDIVETINITKLYDDSGYYTKDGQDFILEPNTLVSMNMFGFYPDFFKKSMDYFESFLQKSGNELKSEFFIPSVLDKMIESQVKKVKVLESPSSWFGVTYQEDKPIVVEKIKNLINQGKYPENLWG